MDLLYSLFPMKLSSVALIFLCGALLCFIFILYLKTQTYLKNTEWLSVEVNNTEHRSYLLKTPTASKNEADNTKYPVIIALHGYTSFPRLLEFHSGLSTLADEKSVFVAYPNGTNTFLRRNRSWNAGVCCNPAIRKGVDDVSFIIAVIEDLAASQPIDPNQIFITGYSNGAIMAHRFAAEKPELITAHASVAGAISGTVNLDQQDYKIQPTKPVPTLLIHGQEDSTVPFNGGLTTSNDARFSAFADTTQAWSSVNTCSNNPASVSISESDSMITAQYDCELAELKTIIVKQAKHEWPGWRITAVTQPFAKPTVSATSLIWEFFDKHQSSQKKILALGDSYTIGTGINPNKSWPIQLAQLLNQNETLFSQPKIIAKNGQTSSELLTTSKAELASEMKYDIISILIGVNDFVRSESPELYRQNIRTLLRLSAQKLTDNGTLVLVLIPDFSVTPAASNFGEKRAIKKGLENLNTIAQQELSLLTTSSITIDGFQLAQTAQNDTSMIASDGLHFSERWYGLLAQQVAEELNNK